MKVGIELSRGTIRYRLVLAGEDEFFSLSFLTCDEKVSWVVRTDEPKFYGCRLSWSSEGSRMSVIWMVRTSAYLPPQRYVLQVALQRKKDEPKQLTSSVSTTVQNFAKQPYYTNVLSFQPQKYS